jgi:hypothetical protein
MKRLGSLVGVLAVLAAGAATAVAAGGPSIHLKAPSSISATKKFSVTASGRSPSRGGQFVFVMFTKKSSCARNVAAAQNRGDVFLPFRGKNGTQVPNGAYSVKTDRISGGGTGSGLFCGYLYAARQPTRSKPEAHASHRITFT